MIAKDTIVTEATTVEKVLSECKRKSDLIALIEQYGFNKSDITVWPRFVSKENNGKSWKTIDELEENETFNRFCIDAIWPDSHISVYEFNLDQKNLKFEVWDKSINDFEPISRVETLQSFIDGYDALNQKYENGAPDEIFIKTNIGTMPLIDYYEIRAIQCGYEDYEHMLKAGLHFDIDDIDPSYLITKNHNEVAQEKEEISKMLEAITDKSGMVIDSIEKNVKSMEKGEVEWEI